MRFFFSVSLLLLSVHVMTAFGNEIVNPFNVPPELNVAEEVPPIQQDAGRKIPSVSELCARAASESAHRFTKAVQDNPHLFESSSQEYSLQADPSLFWFHFLVKSRIKDEHGAYTCDWIWFSGNSLCSSIEPGKNGSPVKRYQSASTLYALSSSTSTIIKLLERTNKIDSFISLSGTGALRMRDNHEARKSWARQLRRDVGGLSASEFTQPDREAASSATQSARISISIDGFTAGDRNITQLGPGIVLEQIEWLDADGTTLGLWWVHPNRTRAMVLFDRRVHMAWFESRPFARLPDIPEPLK